MSSESTQSACSLIWAKIIWRQWCREPKVPAILMLILALGVAVFLAVRLANRAAVTGFAIFTDSIAGDSNLLVRPKSGAFNESDLLSLRDQMGATPASIFPVLDTTAAASQEVDARIYRLVGTDFVALPNSAYLSDDKLGKSPFEASQSGFVEMLGRSDLVFVGEDFAKGKGDKIEIFLEGQKKIVTIAGILKNDALRPKVPDNLLVLDLPGAQELTGNQGILSRLEIRVPPGPDFDKNLLHTRSVLEKWAGERFVIETPGQRKSSATQMSAAFRLNLTILSTLALVVGAYLILQAMEASVIKRRSEIAILRCLGVKPKEIQKSWLLESIILGVGGSVLGIVLGYLLAQGMVRAIASTVNTLYYETTSRSAGLDWFEIAIAFGFGVVVSLFAGWLPAREAANVPPALSVSQGTRGGGLKLLQNPIPGIVLTVLAICLAFVPPYTSESGNCIPIGGYFSAFLFLAGFSILAGGLFPLVSKWLKLGKESPNRGYAASQFRLCEGRHRLAAAGLLAAFGMSAAMGILVASFDGTLNAWIRQMLKADVYIAAAGGQSAISESKIAEDVWQDAVKTPGIIGVDRLRTYSIDFEGSEAWLAGADYNNTGRYLQLIWVNPPKNDEPDALDKMVGNRYPAWISESFSRKYKKRVGDQFMIPGGDRERPVSVEGVYADYGSERGTILVSRAFTSEWYSDRSLKNLAIYLQAGIDEDRWVADFQAKYPGLVARTNRKLRGDALRLFKDTFRVTYALEGIAIVIAVAGLGLAMVGLLLERQNELRTLKELGMSRMGIARAAMWEGLGLSLVGLIGGLALAIILGLLLVYVINRQSFGWTLSFRIPWALFFGLMATMLVTGGLVAGIVGYRIANLQSDRKEA